MKQIMKMVLVLTVLGLVSGLVLSLVSNYATPIINENNREAIKEAIFYVLPKTEDYEVKTIEGKDIYVTRDSEGQVNGYAFTASGSGYQGTIELMVGVNSNLEEIQGIQVLDSSETPGLGGKIRGDNFKNKFRGEDASGGVSLVKSAPTEPGEIEAITGATISSKAVVDIINKGLDQVQEIMGSGG
ncbi:MAG: RnfABCDGE type electron transport complex subunit G [Candidatus Acetothermia bacterium]